MRLLNEKTMSKLCQQRRCTREGYLRMRRFAPAAPAAGSEKRQYFRLCGNFLYYLDRPQDAHPGGVIVLAGHVVEPAEDRDNQSATFCISFQDACTYQLTASSEEEAALWMHAVIGAAHECAQSLADSLRDQLQAITLGDATSLSALTKIESSADVTAAVHSLLVSSSAKASAALSVEFSKVLDQRLEAVYQLMLACSEKQSS